MEVLRSLEEGFSEPPNADKSGQHGSKKEL